jgi:hypothetical protein
VAASACLAHLSLVLTGIAAGDSAAGPFAASNQDRHARERRRVPAALRLRIIAQRKINNPEKSRENKSL